MGGSVPCLRESRSCCWMHTLLHSHRVWAAPLLTHTVLLTATPAVCVHTTGLTWDTQSFQCGKETKWLLTWLSAVALLWQCATAMLRQDNLSLFLWDGWLDRQLHWVIPSLQQNKIKKQKMLFSPCDCPHMRFKPWLWRLFPGRMLCQPCFPARQLHLCQQGHLSLHAAL